MCLPCSFVLHQSSSCRTISLTVVNDSESVLPEHDGSVLRSGVGICAIEHDGNMH